MGNIKGFGRKIEGGKFHIGWFDEGYPHGYGVGNMYTRLKEDIKEGWYEKKQGDQQEIFFKEHEDVTYDKESETTKKFDVAELFKF